MEKQSDIFEAIKIQKGMLQKTGVWPQRSKTAFYKFRQITSWIIDIVIFFAFLLEFRLNLSENDYKHMTELLTILASDISYLTKNAIFLKNSDKFMNTLDKLKDPLFKSYPMVCDKYVVRSTKYSKILARVYQFLIINVVLFYWVKPWVTKENSAVRFEAFELGAFRMPVHLFQVIAIGSGCWNNSSLDLLALGLISSATAQLEILKEKLINITQWSGFTYEEVDRGAVNRADDVSNDKVYARIKECVEHHLAIINYAAALEEIYSYYFLVQFAASVLAICNTWFQFMLTDSIAYIIFLVIYSIALIAQLGIYCLFANNLTLKSADIRDACYQSEWYNCETAVKKSLMIIMERSKRPTVLTAGKLAVLGLILLTNILQSSYSYFTLMNHLYGN